MTLPASVDTPTTADRAESMTGSPPQATPMPEADPAAAEEAAREADMGWPALERERPHAPA